jgi:hypothetical protein
MINLTAVFKTMMYLPLTEDLSTIQMEEDLLTLHPEALQAPGRHPLEMIFMTRLLAVNEDPQRLPMESMIRPLAAKGHPAREPRPTATDLQLPEILGPTLC